jgi:hypothetical protein
MKAVKKWNKMVFLGVSAMMLTFGFILVCCNKTVAKDAVLQISGETATNNLDAVLQVVGEKITNDLEAIFKVQAELLPNQSASKGLDLGIIGTIQNGRLTISVPNPEEEKLFDPRISDIPTNTEGLKIACLHISTSKSSLVLKNKWEGDDWGMETIEIWYANKEGNVGFSSATGLNMAPFKRGWNFVVPGRLFEDATWTSLQDVYDLGFSWEIEDH